MGAAKPPAGRVPDKSVPSTVGHGPVNAVIQVQRHRDHTVEDGPTTVGVNPDPSRKLAAPDMDPLTSGTPYADTQATAFAPFGGGSY